ncbi:MAG: hypothetical protein OXH99_02545 [Bryobacterales bacterium]|nr:hypothetical protein [Bryobacterales bacterium]
MRTLPKRDFLRLAGLEIADRLVPPWLRPQPSRPSSDDRKLILVTFGGRCRYQETFAPEGLRDIPRLAALRLEGRFFSSFVNSGVLSHYDSTSSIVTAIWQRVDDFGFEQAKGPTIFEYYRKSWRRPATDAWAICTNKSFASMGATRVRGYGGAVGANVVLPNQLLLEAVDEVIKRDKDQGVADRENVLRQLEGILNAGYEGIG